MLSKLSARRGQRGFTLIELLVTIVIIGILAAVAMLAYNHQTAKADRSAGIQDLTMAAQAAESFGTDNSGSYAGLNGNLPSLIQEGYKSNKVSQVSADANDYCLSEVTPKGVALKYDSNDGKATDGTCDGTPGATSGDTSWFNLEKTSMSFPGGRTASITDVNFTPDGSGVYFTVRASDDGPWTLEFQNASGAWEPMSVHNPASEGDPTGWSHSWSEYQTPITALRLIDSDTSEADAIEFATITPQAN